MKTVTEIMRTPVIGLKPNQLLSEVLEMFEHKMISGAPVLEDDGVVIGVLSQKDITAHLSRHGSLDHARVESAMTPFVFYTRPHDSIRKPLEAMVESRIHRLVVVDEQHRAVGIVTSLDLLAELLKILPLDQPN